MRNKEFLMRSIIGLILLFFHPLVGAPSEGQKAVEVCIDSQLAKIIRECLEKSEIVEHPFPHLVIHDFFPEEFYENFIHFWPHPHQFSPPCNGRYSILLDQLKGTSLSKEQKAFWGAFNDYLVETVIKPIVIEKFLPYLHVKFPNASDEEIQWMLRHFTPVAKTNSIYLDTPRCSVITHTDKPHYFVQIIFYLPKENDHQKVGTSFFSGSPHPGGEDTCWDTPSDLTFHAKIPFRKNTFIAFLQSPISWHALERSPYPKFLRRTFFSPILIPPEVYIKHYGMDKFIVNYLEQDINN